MNRPVTLALAPLSAAYAAGVTVRNALYRRGVFRSRNGAATVISVGNITVGGTGKTPLVAWVAREVASYGKRVCILTRGYGRHTTGRVVVSDGNDTRADIWQSGDEAFLLAEDVRDRAAVVCDADRVAGAQWAIQNLNSEVLILDDGFQHRRLARDVDIVVVDATNPWGNGRMLPGGTLREPISELSRADCIVITRTNDVDNVELLQQEIRKAAGAPLFLSRMKLTEVASLGPGGSGEGLKGQPMVAFCGIGNPRSFFSLLHRAGYQVTETRTFRDHHNYTQRDIDRIVSQARSCEALALITTAKDAVKLRKLNFALPCYVAEIAIEIDRADDFRALLRHATLV